MELYPPKSFYTNRLIMEACRIEDAQDLFSNYTSSQEASKYLQRKPHDNIKKTENFIKNWGADNWDNCSGNYAWSMKKKKSGEAFGVFILIVKSNEAEIHFGMQATMSGQGLATEAGLTIIEWLKNEASIKKISTVCDIEHKSSQNVLSKIGLKKTKLLEKTLLLPAKGNQYRDAWLYEWSK
tara:strand:- start:56267 stop:56812 length:546 start_codon:yes stop_codon:yes gene_type:complete